MLPYETERHARGIFAKLIIGLSSNNGEAPGEAEANALATEAVRIAQDFATVAGKRALSHAGTGIPQLSKVLTFEQLVLEWQNRGQKAWEQANRKMIFSRFQRYLFPTLAGRPANEITSPEIVAILRRVEDAGYLPLAHLLLAQLKRLFCFAIASGYAKDNPAADLSAALFRRRPRRRDTILAPSRIGELLRTLDTYHGTTSSKYMLRILPYVFVRPGELRKAEWAEFDFKRKEWRIPAHRMKSRRPHIVPLSAQAIKRFREVHRLSGRGRFVFPGRDNADCAISDSLFRNMLWHLGLKGVISASGFRSMAATLLSEQGWNPDAIERQLSHADPRSIPRTYNFAEYLPERRKMMQAWADYLDKLAGR